MTHNPLSLVYLAYIPNPPPWINYIHSSLRYSHPCTRHYLVEKGFVQRTWCCSVTRLSVGLSRTESQSCKTSLSPDSLKYRPVEVRERHSGKIGMFASCTATVTSPVTVSCLTVHSVVNHGVVKETVTVLYIITHCWEGSLSVCLSACLSLVCLLLVTLWVSPPVGCERWQDLICLWLDMPVSHWVSQWVSPSA